MNDEQIENLNKDIQKCVKQIEGIINNINTLDLKELNDSVTKAYRIYQKFPNSEDLAFGYVITLSWLSSKQDSPEEIKKNVAKAYDIYQKFPNSEDLAYGCIVNLSWLSKKQDSPEEIKKTEARAYDIYQKFPNSAILTSVYSYILVKLVNKKRTLEEIEEAEARAYNIYRQSPNSVGRASVYLYILVNLANKQRTLEEIEETEARAYGIYQKFPNSEVLAVGYVSILSSLSSKQDSPEEIKKTKARAYDIYQQFPNLEELAVSYVSILSSLSSKQDSPEAIKKNVAKAYDIYQQFPYSEDIAFQYVITLTILSAKEGTLEAIKKNEAKVYDVYQQFPNSEAIASYYVVALIGILAKQDSPKKLEDIVTKAIKVYNRFSNTKSIIRVVGNVISDYIYKFIINSPKEQKDKTEDRINILFSYLSNVNTELIVAIIDNIFSSYNHLIRLTNYKVQITSRLLNHFSTIVSLHQTKYAVLINLLRGLKNTGCHHEPLIKVYYLVQKIKFQLSIKDFSNLNFGHYTSGEVLQILIKQESNCSENGYSIESRTRLGNVKYMNDPEEGRVLDRYLKPKEINNLEVSLKPSPWFLMSLTTAIDDLAMWSQYGAKAEGVCLVFKPDSFAVVESVGDIEWITRKNYIPIFEKNSISPKYEEMNSLYKKDFLYRICYLDEKSLNNDESNVVKKNNNRMLKSKEIKIINSCLKQIKTIVNNIQKDSLLHSAVEECLEEIRYLFKVSGYSYESELRILQYAELTHDNKKIKIDNSGPVAKLYLERDIPIQLKQVIFGPKFSKPEHVTPLLHLLDNTIEFKRSERKFK